MPCKITLRRNSDGAERVYDEHFDWDEGTEFIWTEGNYACDCNRSVCFALAAGEDETDHPPCGHSAYSIVRVTLPDGREIAPEQGGSVGAT